MQKRERSHDPLASAAKRARIDIPHHHSTFDLALSGQGSGLAPADWQALVSDPRAHMCIPDSLNWMILEDGTAEANKFIDYLEKNLTSGTIGPNHRLIISREWYCFKSFLFECLIKIRTEIVALTELVKTPNRDISNLVTRLLNVDDCLYNMSVQYIYNAPVGQALARYCRSHDHVLTQPFLNGFVSSSLSEFLWPVFEPLFVWDYIDTSLNFKTRKSNADATVQQSETVEPESSLSFDDLLMKQEYFDYESALQSVKDLILRKSTETSAQNLIRLIDLKAERGPASDAEDFPILSVDNDAILSFVGSHLAICTASDRSAQTLEMHRVLVDYFRNPADLTALDRQLPWSRMPKICVDVAEVWMKPRRNNLRTGRRTKVCGFNQIESYAAEQAETDKECSQAADLICRVGNVAWNVYRIHVLLVKLREKPIEESLMPEETHIMHMS